MRLPVRWSWLLLAAFLFAPSALGTAQMPDYLLIDGVRVTLHTNPLAKWLKDHPSALLPAKVDSSGNWRGYVATWEIDKDKLWLRKVEIAVGTRYEEEWDGVDETYPFIQQDVMDQLFPGGSAVMADWYSGLLIVPKGKLVERVHMGYQSSYERYTLLWIRQGELSRRMDLDAKQYLALREERFAAYKLTKDYRRRMAVVEADESAAEHEQHLFAAPEAYLSTDPGPTGR